MVQLEDTTYADLTSRALRTDALEVECARLKAEKSRIEEEMKAQIEAAEARIKAEFGSAEAIPETPAERESVFEFLRLQAENQRLREKLGLAIRRTFGASSERRISGQEAFLFNEVEAEACTEAPEPLRQVAAYVRRKKKAGQRELQLGGLEIREVSREIPESDRICPLCSEPMRKMGENERIKVEIAPIQITVIREKQDKYCCCSPDNHPLHTPIVTAPLPATVFPRSLATPSSVAYIMYLKYVMGVPLYRMEQDLAQAGFPLSRQTMANWVIAGALLLDRIYVRLHKQLLREEILHADETTMQVLNEEDRKPTAQSYMWLYRTGRYSHPIVLYDYQPTRGREHPIAFLKGFKGRLTVDGLASYEKLPDITLSGCWAHARRGFVEAIDALPAAARAKGTTISHEGLAFCNKIFEIERDLHDCTPELRQAGRDTRTRAVLAAFRIWLDKTVIDALPKSPLGKAVRYCIRQWEKLICFLNDGRLEVDNNRAERSIKPFVIGRKNWLFANTTSGADASATVYSIVETAKENGLDPRSYLQFLFEQFENRQNNADHASIDKLLPWNAAVQATCAKTRAGLETEQLLK